MTPRVSIALPVYNGEKYLTKALDSILAQEFEDFELIISDNASTDCTQDICETYVRRDERVSYSRLPENLGAAPNFNRVVQMARGELFKWAAHDDLIHPAFLTRCVEVFDAFDSPPALVHPTAEFIDERGRVLRPDTDEMRAASDHSWVRAFDALQAINMVAAIAGVFHMETLRRSRLVGSFVGSDYVLLLEAALLGKIIKLDGEPMFQRRIHEESSREANLSDEDVLRWFDPKARLALSPRKKIYLEYLRSPFQILDCNTFEKLLCAMAIVLGVSFKSTRVFVGRQRRRLMSGLATGSP